MDSTDRQSYVFDNYTLYSVRAFRVHWRNIFLETNSMEQWRCEKYTYLLTAKRPKECELCNENCLRISNVCVRNKHKISHKPHIFAIERWGRELTCKESKLICIYIRYDLRYIDYEFIWKSLTAVKNEIWLLVEKKKKNCGKRVRSITL